MSRFCSSDKLPPGNRDGDAPPPAEIEQVLELRPCDARPGLDGAVADRFARVGNDEIHVHVDDAPEAAAVRAGACRRVEGKRVRRRLPVGDIAGWALEGRTESLRPSCCVHVHLSLPGSQGHLQGVDDPLSIFFPEDQAVGHDIPGGIAAGLFQGQDFASLPDPVVAGASQLLLPCGGIAVDGHREGQDDGGVFREFLELAEDGLGRVFSYGVSASAAGEGRHPREEELRVVGDLRHGPHGGPGGPDGVALLDGQGRRNPLDPLDKGTVHAVEELAGIGGEGLDVAALALGVERVEGKGGLAGAAHTGDDGQGVEGDVEIEAFEVMLPDPEDPDGIQNHDIILIIDPRNGNRSLLQVLIFGLIMSMLTL